MTWDHLKFLALLIPTWLLIGAAALTLAVPSNDRIRTPPPASERQLFGQVPDSGAPGGFAAYHFEPEPVPEWD